MHMHTARRVFVSALTFGIAGSALAAGCSSENTLPPTTSTTSNEVVWQRVQIRVTPERYGEFEEGGGLVRRLEADEVSGETHWWIGRFPTYEIERLTNEGFEIRPLDSSLTKPLANTGGSCTTPPLGSIVDKFCPYDKSSVFSKCKRSIYTELSNAATEFPPIGGTTYVQSFDYGTTHEGRKLRAVRVGKKWTSGAAVPQYVVYAAQHAREWAGPEFLMRLYRYYANSWKNNTNGVRSLLANAAIVIVPVANPDGYEFTHQAATNRLWRSNRQPCSGGIGTDINRNNETTWGQPGLWSSTCGDLAQTFRGTAPLSAPESTPLLKLFANDGFSGSYVTRFALNVHSYGNYMLFPEGLNTAPDFKFCTTDSNCTAPDHGILQKLVGSEQNIVMQDEESNRPYVVGQSFRHLYAVAGDSVAPAVYGTPSRPSDPRFLSATIEVTNTECGFQAEGIPSGDFNLLFDRFRQLNTQILSAVPTLGSSFVDDLSLPHLHRRQVTGDGNEFPTIRVAEKPNLGPLDFGAAGTTEIDDVRDGAKYRMWRFRSDDPYVFPTEIEVCVKNKCQTTSVGEEGTGKVDLCDPNRFDSPGPGWSFAGDQPGGPGEECFWKHSGASVGTLTSRKWSISNMVKASLVFSYRWDEVSKMTVSVSTNGFVGCSYNPGTGCRIVREFPFGSNNYEFRDEKYRTEIIDISEFDHADSIQVRFEVTSTGGNGIDIFDPIMIGWKG
jgi:hypothetical protein